MPLEEALEWHYDGSAAVERPPPVLPMGEAAGECARQALAEAEAEELSFLAEAGAKELEEAGSHFGSRL